MTRVYDEFNDSNNIVVRSIINDLGVWFHKVKENCKGQSLSVIHLNIRSLRKHWNELSVVLKEIKGTFDILVLSEISVTEVDDVYTLEGYNVHCYTRQEKVGGGILLFYKNDMKFISNNCKFDCSENLTGEIILSNNVRIFFSAFYRPPNTSKSRFVNEFDNFISNVKFKRCIIIGDMNLDLLDDADRYVQLYENIMYANGFYKCTDSATREEMSNDILSSTCLDNIYIYDMTQ